MLKGEHLVDNNKIKEYIYSYHKIYHDNNPIVVEKNINFEYQDIKNTKKWENIARVISIIIVFVFIFAISKITCFILEQEANIKIDLTKYILILLVVGIITRLLFFNKFDYKKGKRIGKLTIYNSKLILTILNDDDFTDKEKTIEYLMDEIKIITKNEHESENNLLNNNYIIYIVKEGKKEKYYFDAIKKENEFYALLIYIKYMMNNKDVLNITNQEIDNYLLMIHTGK